MGETTAIAWTSHSFNTHWGCERVSPGCQNCYAETFAKRTGNDVWGKNNTRRFFGDKHWNEPLKWDRDAAVAGKPGLVFCASMGDVFEARDDLDDIRVRLWDLIAHTPHLIWQLLTKRPQNVLGMVPAAWLTSWTGIWPENVWIGTTVEDQTRADERIPLLLGIPAKVRFLSCEPLLGPVDISLGYPFTDIGLDEPDIQWVIVGGESGPKHRPMKLDHARRLVAQAQAFGIPTFFKQVGGRTPTAGGDMLDGHVIKQFPPSAMR